MTEPYPKETVKELGEEPNDSAAPQWQGVTPKDRLALAKWVLLVTAVIFFFSGMAVLINPAQGAAIFDACKTILPPIVTLILGYYFGESNQRD